MPELNHASKAWVLVMAGHLHHDAPERQKQWKRVRPLLQDGPHPIIMLHDNNSHMVPAADNWAAKERRAKGRGNGQWGRGGRALSPWAECGTCDCQTTSPPIIEPGRWASKAKGQMMRGRLVLRLVHPVLLPWAMSIAGEAWQLSIYQ